MYYWYVDKSVFLLLTIYDKDEKDDLTKPERDILKKLIEHIKKGAKR